MGAITEAMLKRRSEHNDGILHDLEELVLQEESLERIDKILGILCPHLKFLYMPNNLIARIENLHRLKELKYLNLALNNITKIEGLEQCESLEKLDLTLNFVDQSQFVSVSKLSSNVHLRELFLIGNPCQDVPGYRLFVIAKLTQLKRLDGIEIKPSERIRAKQELDAIVIRLNTKNNVMKTETTLNKTTPAINDKGQVIREYTPETRLAEHAELEEMRRGEKKQEQEQDSKKTSRRSGFDPLPTEGRIYQKNEGGWNFRLMESECNTKVMLDVPVGRFMDTSLIQIDIQPTLVRVLVKGKLLQLLLPDEVNPDGSIAQRSTTTGNLLISMPKANSNGRINIWTKETSSLFYEQPPKKHTRAKHRVCEKQETSILQEEEHRTIQKPSIREKNAQENVSIMEADLEDLPELE